MLGKLISTLGLSEGVAIAVLTALSTGGVNIVSALWPMLYPVMWTLQGLLITAGSGAVLGF